MMVEAQQKKQAKKMLWITLAMMAFSTVWGFGNVVNGYVYFDSTKIIFSWGLMFLLYFIPLHINGWGTWCYIQRLRRWCFILG